MQAGKLELDSILELFSAGLGAERSDVIAGPSVGVDCAVVSVGDGRCAVLKSDPITFATERIGWYAVHVNANDIATSGADPCWFLSTILLPISATEETAKRTFAQIHEAAASIGVAVVGGHTETTPAVSHVVVAGTMVGLVDEEKLILPRNITPGDVLIVTKGAAVEATAIIANEKKNLLSERTSADIQRRAAAFLDDPGISVMKDARIVRQFAPHGMHDATEGGIRAAVYEMAQAGNCSVALDETAVPVHSVTLQACHAFGLDPLGSISSGALLAALQPSTVDEALAALQEEGIEAARIGTFIPGDQPSTSRREDGTTQALEYEPCDEITKLFEDEQG